MVGLRLLRRDIEMGGSEGDCMYGEGVKWEESSLEQYFGSDA